MKKRRRLKRQFKILFRLISFILIIIFIMIIYKLLSAKKYINSINYVDNSLEVNLIENDNLYCILSDEKPDLSSNKWIKSNNNICLLKYNNEKNIYIKNNNKILYSSNKDIFYKIKDEENIYLANNDNYFLFDYLLGNIKKINIEPYDKKIIDFEDGFIKSKKPGTTTLSIKYNDEIKSFKVTVTELINKRISNMYDNNKEKLKCENYTKEENDLLDQILESRIKSVGYKTRAGVVEAARFLTLEFPYKINYFYENGRIGTNKVDGEGRYYHKGLYLDESRYESISGSSTLSNIGSWGCSIYSVPISDYDENGLDCSGFVSWVLLNGGFDPGDLGAGFTKAKNLTDYGELKRITENNSTDGTIKVGDLLHNERNGGHIAIIVGIDNDYYYVAQAIWFNEVGVVISKYKKDELKNEFPHVVLMDKYYKNDGNLKNMW